MRPTLTFGLGTYWESFPFSVVYTDSLGNQTRDHGRRVEHHEGANLGLGLTWGHGPARPDLEARIHYVHPRYDSGRTWITLQAGVTYN